MEDIARQLKSSPQGLVSVDEVLRMLEKAKMQAKSPVEYKIEGGKEWSEGSEEYSMQAPMGAFPGRARGGRGGPGGPMMGAGTRTSTQREQAVRFRFTPINVLVLTDGSEHSHKALEAALHFRRRNDHLFVVNCVQLAGKEGEPEYTEANRALKTKGKAVIDEARQEINEREIGRWVCASVAAVDPKKAALEYAKKQDVSVIFVGTRGTDSTSGTFYPGSFAKYVFDNADVSVMLVR